MSPRPASASASSPFAVIQPGGVYADSLPRPSKAKSDDDVVQQLEEVIPGISDEQRVRLMSLLAGNAMPVISNDKKLEAEKHFAEAKENVALLERQRDALVKSVGEKDYQISGLSSASDAMSTQIRDMRVELDSARSDTVVTRARLQHAHVAQHASQSRLANVEHAEAMMQFKISERETTITALEESQSQMQSALNSVYERMQAEQAKQEDQRRDGGPMIVDDDLSKAQVEA